MSFKFKSLPSALDEWKKLAPPVQQKFKKKLKQRAEGPHFSAYQLRGFKTVYKIDLSSAGYRLVCEINGGELVIYVITVGKMYRALAYNKAEERK